MCVATLHITLFGKFTILRDEQFVDRLAAHKLLELFAYLLINRNRQHPREAVADRFWSEHSTPQARTLLRKALWELQSAITGHCTEPQAHVLLVDSEWIQINPKADFWLDVAEFEQAFQYVKDLRGEDIDEARAQRLQAAVELYRGDLLEGWYHDWCIYERERLQLLYLSILDKLMGYCEMQRHYDQGIGYGMRILHYDRAHEQTYRRLMRLYFLAGDRTAALRLYERCETALQDELGVGPTENTMALRAQIKANRLVPQERPGFISTVVSPCNEASAILSHLYTIQNGLDAFREQVEHEIHLIARALETRQ